VAVGVFLRLVAWCSSAYPRPLFIVREGDSGCLLEFGSEWIDREVERPSIKILKVPNCRYTGNEEALCTREWRTAKHPGARSRFPNLISVEREERCRFSDMLSAGEFGKRKAQAC